MTTVQQVLDAIETIAPASMAFPHDRIGLQIGRAEDRVSRVVLTFDGSLAALDFAAGQHAELVIGHHPIIWDTLASMVGESYNVRRVRRAIEGRIAYIASHTNWDACPGGLNDWLAQALGLQGVRPAGSRAKPALMRLIATVPTQSATSLLDALSAAGAGAVGAYDRCAFLGEGVGTFRPLVGANPTIGSIGKVEEVRETRLEMIVPASAVHQVTAALVASHPYEVPDFAFVAMEPTHGQQIARVGSLPSPMAFHDFVSFVDGRLGSRSLAWHGGHDIIQSVAVCGGAADDQWQECVREGAQVLVTGEVKQHVALEAGESGCGMVAAGHYATEHPSMHVLCAKLAAAIPAVEWQVFTPEPGASGRPLDV